MPENSQSSASAIVPMPGSIFAGSSHIRDKIYIVVDYYPNNHAAIVVRRLLDLEGKSEDRWKPALIIALIILEFLMRIGIGCGSHL